MKFEDHEERSRLFIVTHMSGDSSRLYLRLLVDGKERTVAMPFSTYKEISEFYDVKFIKRIIMTEAEYAIFLLRWDAGWKDVEQSAITRLGVA